MCVSRNLGGARWLASYYLDLLLRCLGKVKNVPTKWWFRTHVRLGVRLEVIVKKLKSWMNRDLRDVRDLLSMVVEMVPLKGGIGSMGPPRRQGL